MALDKKVDVHIMRTVIVINIYIYTYTYMLLYIVIYKVVLDFITQSKGEGIVRNICGAICKKSRLNTPGATLWFAVKVKVIDIP